MTEQIINMYTANTVNNGDQGLYIVKVMVQVDQEDCYFALYRCAHYLTPGQDPLTDTFGIPQGDRIHGTDEELKAIVRLLFPILHQLNAEPLPY